MDKVTQRLLADSSVASNIETVSMLVGQLPAGNSFTAEQVESAAQTVETLEAYVEALKASIQRAKQVRLIDGEA